MLNEKLNNAFVSFENSDTEIDDENYKIAQKREICRYIYSIYGEQIIKKNEGLFFVNKYSINWFPIDNLKTATLLVLNNSSKNLFLAWKFKFISEEFNILIDSTQDILNILQPLLARNYPDDPHHYYEKFIQLSKRAVMFESISNRHSYNLFYKYNNNTSYGGEKNTFDFCANELDSINFYLFFN
jgi:hypothetical protein